MKFIVEYDLVDWAPSPSLKTERLTTEKSLICNSKEEVYRILNEVQDIEESDYTYSIEYLSLFHNGEEVCDYRHTIEEMRAYVESA